MNFVQENKSKIMSVDEEEKMLNQFTNTQSSQTEE